MMLKEFYKREIYKYGFLPLLTLLKYYEVEEKYEECESILLALEEHYKEHNLNLQYKLNEIAIEDYAQGFWEHGMSAETALKNVPYYAVLIDKERQLQIINY